MSDHEGSALHEEDGISVARRTGAMAAAGHAGDELAARAGLADPDPAVRAAAFGALIRIGAATLSDVEQAFADPSPVVRRRAAELAWRANLAPSDLTLVVARQLEDGESEVVEAACYCLGELQSAGMTSALAGVATGHSDPLCRESAVAALGAIGEPDALAVILACLEDRPPVRRRAVLALASFEGAEVEAALVRALEDRDWQVRQAAEDLTGSRPGSS